MSAFFPPGLGWHNDVPDFRDLTPRSLRVHKVLRSLKRRRKRPASVDLRDRFPQAADQGRLNSSAAHACLSLTEYFERQSHGRMVPLSRMFLYKNVRNLLRTQGDTGADLRTTLKAAVRFGAPPECYWPYRAELVDADPSPFLYSYADEFRSIRYVRLDVRNGSGADTLKLVKSFLAAGFPVAFGFPVPSSLSDDADIPYRPTFDSILGGQAVVACGYDDRRFRTIKGALLFRNSWGCGWGEDGYGWLPYAYVLQQLAAAFWTVLRPDWVESGEFEQPRLPK